MSNVSQILEHKGGMVLSVESGDTVFEAISLMSEVNIGAVLVQKDNNIIGIFTERDYLQKVALKMRTSKNLTVGEVMTSPVITVRPSDSVQHCMETMTTCRCRHLPVVENDKLLGIISIGDLVKVLVDEKEAEIAQLSHYITGSY